MKRSILVPFLLLSAVVLWFVRRPSSAHESSTVAARELLTLAQESSGASFTFDRSTSRALEETRVPRLPSPVRIEALSRALEGAGFELQPLGASERKVYVIRPAGG